MRPSMDRQGRSDKIPHNRKASTAGCQNLHDFDSSQKPGNDKNWNHNKISSHLLLVVFGHSIATLFTYIILLNE